MDERSTGHPRTRVELWAPTAPGTSFSYETGTMKEKTASLSQQTATMKEKARSSSQEAGTMKEKLASSS